VVAVVLAAAASVCLGIGLRGHDRALAGPVGSAARGIPTVGVPPGATATVPPVAYSVPVSLSIPVIGVSTSLSALGANPTGTVEVPTNFQQPGWFQPGPTPGQLGSAVILGHVDNYQGPAVFFRLRTLQAGDQVSVTLADGVVARFAVDAVAMYTKADFPDQQVYGPHDDSSLQLVTCGGTFDADTGHYLSNVVVYTTLVSASPTP
jgi:sortase (surface protein transpeptidase)